MRTCMYLERVRRANKPRCWVPDGIVITISTSVVWAAGAEAPNEYGFYCYFPKVLQSEC